MRCNSPGGGTALESGGGGAGASPAGGFSFFTEPSGLTTAKIVPGGARRPLKASLRLAGAVVAGAAAVIAGASAAGALSELLLVLRRATDTGGRNCATFFGAIAGLPCTGLTQGLPCAGLVPQLLKRDLPFETTVCI